jgi:hypothetical protein
VRLVQTGEIVCARQCEESDVSRGQRLDLQAQAVKVAQRVRHAVPTGTGFCLVLFDFHAKGNMAYASSAQRERAMMMLRELLDKMTAEHVS